MTSIWPALLLVISYGGQCMHYPLLRSLNNWKDDPLMVASRVLSMHRNRPYSSYMGSSANNSSTLPYTLYSFYFVMY